MRMTASATKLLSPPHASGAAKLAAAAAFAAACGLHAINGAAAQSYPTKPIKIISPTSAGSPPDTVSRLVGQKLAERFDQSVVVENRPGAGATIGTKAAATADPDGYTLLQVYSAFAYAPLLYRNPGYDPAKSFVPVAALASWSFLLVVPADVPAGTVQELIAYAKANPDKINIGHTLGSPPQILAQMIKAASGAPFNTVPYREVSLLTSDLVSGRIQAFFGTGGRLISLVREGKLKALAYTGVTRHPALPQVPTAIESGLPQLTLSDWIGLVAPAGTPAEAIKTLNAATNEALASPQVRATFAKLGWDAKVASPQEFTTFVAAEVKKWPALVNAAGLKPN